MKLAVLNNLCLNLASKRNICTSSGKFKVGDKAVLEKVITANDLQLFKEVTGDWNPIHFQTKSPAIVHGGLINGFVSAVLGTTLPGPGSILTEQVLKFPNPCYAGEKVTVVVEVVSVRKIIECNFNCSVGEKVVLFGTAKLIINSNW